MRQIVRLLCFLWLFLWEHPAVNPLEVVEGFLALRPLSMTLLETTQSNCKNQCHTAGSGDTLALDSNSSPSCLLLCGFEPGSGLCPGERGAVVAFPQEAQDGNSSHASTCLLIPMDERCHLGVTSEEGMVSWLQN